MEEKRDSRFSRADLLSEIPTGLGKKRSEEQLRLLEQKLETLQESLTDVEIQPKTPSTGRTVKRGRAPMDSAFQSLMEVKESVHTRLQDMMREQQLLREDISASTPPRSERSGSPNPKTFRIDDSQYQNLKQCQNIVDNLFDQEFQRFESIRKRNFTDGNLFSGDNLPSRRDSSASIKVKRKILVEKICLMGQQLKELESLEKI